MIAFRWALAFVASSGNQIEYDEQDQ